MARVTNSLNSVARYIIISRLPVLSDDDTHEAANPRQPLKILFSAARSLIAGILIGIRHSVIAEQIAAWLAAIPLKRNLTSKNIPGIYLCKNIRHFAFLKALKRCSEDPV